MFKQDYTPKTATATIGSSGPDIDTDNLTGFRLFEKGETLFIEGKRGAEAYVIKSGSVRISVIKNNVWESIGIRGADTIVGEMAIIADMPRMATATAEEETICITLSRWVLRQLLEKADLETRTIIEFLVNYIRESAERGDAAAPDPDQVRRNLRILDHLLRTPEMVTKLEKLDPFFALLCRNLLERAQMISSPN